MTPKTQTPASSSLGQHLEVEDWNVMFCAVLARLSAAIEPLDLESPQWSGLPECLESLQMLRRSAVQQWGPLEHASSLNSSVTRAMLVAMAESKAKLPTDGSVGSDRQL